MPGLSVVIITLNEAENIGRCIHSVRGLADEILVVDSGSTDETVPISLAAGARVVHQPFLGYVQQKNFATSQAKNDWVLSLDADEALTPELADEIKQVMVSPAFNGYEMPRLTNYCGHWVKYGGWYPDRKLRLYNRFQGNWMGIWIHERYELRGGQKAGMLQNILLHYSYNSLSEHIGQIDKFSALSAREFFERGVRSNIFKLIFNPLARFISGYFLKRGFLDGLTGLIIACNSAHGVFLKYLRILRLQQGKRL